MSLDDKIMKLNEQRFATIIILCNILDADSGVSNSVKSAVAASLLSMMERSMIDEDEPLKNLLNHSIDRFCMEIEETKGIENFKQTLVDRVEEAKGLVDELNAKARRIREADEILKGICLN
jgi:hypothetical protein